MKVIVFRIDTTDGPRYGLKNYKTGDVLHGCTARYKTAKGAEGYARRHGYDLFHSYNIWREANKTADSIEWHRLNGTRILDKLPDGWRWNEGARTAPRGYMWASHGSLFGGTYEHALVKTA